MAWLECSFEFIDEVGLKDVTKRGKDEATFDLLKNKFESKVLEVLTESHTWVQSQLHKVNWPVDSLLKSKFW